MPSSVPPLPMSSIIASDAPLLSPVESTWPIYSPVAENFNPLPTYTYTQDACNVLPVEVLKSIKQEPTQPCLPTHQLFDLQQQQLPQQPQLQPSQQPLLPPPPPSQPTVVAPAAPKRSSTPPTPAPKKRVVGERISTKDFVPPDVSGLSKREARLVKNRAAAFLSRQRKREEFEAMESRVSDLERDNARLVAITQSSGSPSGELVSEIELLKAQLAAAQKRERELSAELDAKSSIKEEAVDSDSYLLKPPSASHKSAASLGLMVLLCALPSLLSMPTATHHQSAAFPTTFSLPHSMSSNSAFDMNSYFGGGNEFDWSSRNPTFETDEAGKLLMTPQTRKLEFSNLESNILSGLDISFDASQSEDGKIRVRIHHPSSSGASSRAPSPAASSSSSSYQGLNPWDLSSSDSDPGLSFSDHTSSPSPSYNDPFMGVGGNSPVFSSLSSSSSYANDLMPMDYGSDFGSFGSEYGGMSGGTKRRVRIALKTMPSPEGPEGGEWEVQFC